MEAACCSLCWRGSRCVFELRLSDILRTLNLPNSSGFIGDLSKTRLIYIKKDPFLVSTVPGPPKLPEGPRSIVSYFMLSFFIIFCSRFLVVQRGIKNVTKIIKKTRLYVYTDAIGSPNYFKKFWKWE
jgi:hypothetical protein